MPVVPAELRSIGSIAARADELAVVEPTVAYWSRCWIVQRSIELLKGSRSPEVETYLLSVLELLEQMKVQHQGLKDIEDLASGKAKVETFALQVFENADREARSKKADKATSLKFLAAAAFLEVCQVFGKPDKDFLDRRKYAKVQAMRIQTALAAGKDPNARKVPDSKGSATPPPPSIEEQAELDALLSAQTMGTGTIAHRQRSSSIEGGEQRSKVGDIDQLAEHDSISLEANVGPEVEAIPSPANFAANEATYFPTDPSADHVGDLFQPSSSSSLPQPPSDFIDMPSVAQAEIHVADTVKPFGTSKYVVDEFVPDSESIVLAQKHAKWAISALNYEDVATAISELHVALRALQGPGA